MNGIIFQGKSLHIGCTVQFLFEPIINKKNIPAIAEFSTGEKAYSEILREVPSIVTLRIGEYINGMGKRISETAWILSYNNDLESWQILKSLF